MGHTGHIQKKVLLRTVHCTALQKLRTALKNCLRKHNTQLYVVATIADAMVMRRRSMEQALRINFDLGVPTFLFDIRNIMKTIRESSSNQKVISVSSKIQLKVI